MVFRPSFAILDATYKWLRLYDEQESAIPHRLPEEVRSELRAVAALSIYMESNLESSWWPRAYMTDASNEGYGALACDCSEEDVRREAARGDGGSWGPQLEQTYTGIERDQEAVGEEEDLPGCPAAGRPGVLELFAGSGRLLEAIRKLTNSWGEAWDVEKGLEFDVLVTENLELLLRRLKTGWYFSARRTGPESTRGMLWP